jgi:hypothetical protein
MLSRQAHVHQNAVISLLGAQCISSFKQYILARQAWNSISRSKRTVIETEALRDHAL